ncbi:hypothetical protein FDF45_14245 [Clostridium botulinum]|nr:hypothetical protein [Clostridium botulinum]
MKHKRISSFLEKYISDTKEIIKSEKYSEAIDRLKVIYYVLMTKYENKKRIESKIIDIHELNKKNLINEKIIIENELGRRHGFTSDFWLNIILSSEVGIVTGLITGYFMSSDISISKLGQVLGIMFIVLLFLLIKVWINKKDKELLYSLCLDAVESLIDDISQQNN